MKKAYKIVLGLIALVLLLVLVLQIDDDLSPKAQALVDRADWKTPNNSYPYFLGIDAELTASSLDVGNEILAEIRELESTYSNVKSYDEFPVLRDRTTLEFGEYEGFCSLRNDKNCVLTLFSDTDISLSSAKMLAVKDRYLSFLAMDDFRTLTRPHILEPFGAYTFFVKANRLVSLESIALAKSGEPELASDSLYALLQRQRTFLLQADSLIGRLIAYVLINETIEVLSLILAEYKLEGRAIDALSQEELSLNLVISREFIYARSAIEVAQYNDRFNALPDWILRLVLKPNMTMNDALPNYLHAIELSESEQSRFVATLKPMLKYSWFRNLVGSMLNKTSSPDFSDYIARGFDLNVKIALFNGTLNQIINEEILGKIPNPYYENEFDAKVADDRARICMGGPLEDKRRFRCLTFRR